MECPSCNAENNVDNNFCTKCGATLLAGDTPKDISESLLQDTITELYKFQLL